MEIDYGAFQRRIALAEEVDPDGVGASYDRGLLTIVLPLAPRPAAWPSPIEVTADRDRAGGRDRPVPAPEPTGRAFRTSAVLPLKETVVFPELDDAARDRPGALGPPDRRRRRGRARCSRSSPSRTEARAPGLGRPVRDGDGGGRPQDDHGTRRDAAHPRPGPRAHPVSSSRRRTSPTSSAGSRRPGRGRESREVEALTRNVQGLFAADHRARPLPPRGAPGRRGQRRRTERALQPRRVDAAPEDRGEAAAARGSRRRAPAARDLWILNRELEVMELGSKIQSQVQSEIEKGQREFFLRQQLKAIQEELGEGTPSRPRSTSCASRSRRIELPEDVRQGGDARARAPREAAVGRGRVRRHPHLPRLDPLAPWTKTTEDNLDLAGRARSSTRTTTTSTR